MLTRHNREDRNLVKVSIELRNDEEPEPLILYRNPETLWYEVHDVESDKKVTVKDVIDCLRDLGGSIGKREKFIDAIKEKTGASRRLVNDVLVRAENNCSILTQRMKVKGGAKLYYLPEIENRIKQEMEETPGLFSAK